MKKEVKVTVPDRNEPCYKCRFYQVLGGWQLTRKCVLYNKELVNARRLEVCKNGSNTDRR